MRKRITKQELLRAIERLENETGLGEWQACIEHLEDDEDLSLFWDEDSESPYVEIERLNSYGNFDTDYAAQSHLRASLVFPPEWNVPEGNFLPKEILEFVQ